MFGTDLSLGLLRIVREAPLGIALVAFLLGIAVARRRCRVIGARRPARSPSVICDVAIIAHRAVCDQAVLGMGCQDRNIDSRHPL